MRCEHGEPDGQIQAHPSNVVYQETTESKQLATKSPGPSALAPVDRRRIGRSESHGAILLEKSYAGGPRAVPTYSDRRRRAAMDRPALRGARECNWRVARWRPTPERRPTTASHRLRRLHRANLPARGKARNTRANQAPFQQRPEPGLGRESSERYCGGVAPSAMRTADFLRPLRRGVRDHAVDSDARQQQCYGCKQRREKRVQTRLIIQSGDSLCAWW